MNTAQTAKQEGPWITTSCKGPSPQRCKASSAAGLVYERQDRGQPDALSLAALHSASGRPAPSALLHTQLDVAQEHETFFCQRGLIYHWVASASRWMKRRWEWDGISAKVKYQTCDGGRSLGQQPWVASPGSNGCGCC